MFKFHYLTLGTLIVLAFVLAPTIVSSQESLRIQEGVGNSINSNGFTSRMVTIGCELQIEQSALQVTDLDEGIQQTFSIMSMLDAGCNAFYVQYGRMPDSLAELRESGLLLFTPVAQEFSPGLNLVGEDVEIKLTSLSPQETDGGAELIQEVDWNNSTVPGLIVPARETGALSLRTIGNTGRTLDNIPDRLQNVERTSPDSESEDSGTTDLMDEIEAWASLYADINSNGIFLAGFNVDAFPGSHWREGGPSDSPVEEFPGPHWRLGEAPSPVEAFPGSHWRLGEAPSPVEAFPGSHWLEASSHGAIWMMTEDPEPPPDDSPGATAHPFPEPPPRELSSGPLEISYLNANYNLWKGAYYSYTNTLEDNETELKISPWIIASQTPAGSNEFSSLTDLNGSESPEVIKGLLMMESCGIIIENYVGKTPAAPESMTELLGGRWIIDDNSYGNLASVGPGLPGSSKMIIIINTRPADELGIIDKDLLIGERGIIIENMPGEEEGIIIVNGRPSELDPEFDVYFEVVLDSGEAKLYQWVFDSEVGGSYWHGLDPDESAGIIIVNGRPILDSSIAGWGFQTRTLNRMMLNPEDRAIFIEN